MTEPTASSGAATNRGGETAATFEPQRQTVQAIRWTGQNLPAVQAFMAPASPLQSADPVRTSLGLYDRSLTLQFAQRGDWLVRRADGTIEILTEAAFAGQFVPALATNTYGSGGARNVGAGIWHETTHPRALAAMAARQANQDGTEPLDEPVGETLKDA